MRLNKFGGNAGRNAEFHRLKILTCLVDRLGVYSISMMWDIPVNHRLSLQVQEATHWDSIWRTKGHERPDHSKR